MVNKKRTRPEPMWIVFANGERRLASKFDTADNIDSGARIIPQSHLTSVLRRVHGKKPWVGVGKGERPAGGDWAKKPIKRPRKVGGFLDELTTAVDAANTHAATHGQKGVIS
jgi:hypothetical protein